MKKAAEDVIPGLAAISVGDPETPLPPGWRWTRLTDVARMESGHTPSRRHPEYWDGEVPWVGIVDARLHHGKAVFATRQTVTEEGLANSAARWLPANTVCLSRTASVGYVTILGREMATSQDFVNWVCGDQLDPWFLAHALLAEGENLRKFGKGTTHTTIYFPEALAFHIALPSRSIQQRVVAEVERHLTRIDAGVAALERVQANLKRYRASVLKAAVEGGLVPTEAELAKKERGDYEPASKLLARILKERRARWEAEELAKLNAKGRAPTDDRWKAKYTEPEPPDTSELPELPEGWCWATVETVGHVVLGRRRAEREYIDGEDGRVMRRYVRVANVRATHLDLSDLLEMPFNDAELDLYRLEPGDIVVTEGQSPELVGISAVFRGGVENLCIQATVHRFRPYRSGLSTEFAQTVFRFNLLNGVFRKAASLTVNIAHLTSERLKPLPFPLPPEREQARIVEEVERRLTLADDAERAIRTQLARADRLRRSVLRQAFEGKLVPPTPGADEVPVLRGQRANGSGRSASSVQPKGRRASLPLREEDAP